MFRVVATGWTGVDMSTPLLPEAIPEIDANPMTFGERVGEGGKCKRACLSIPVVCRSVKLVDSDD